MARIAIVTDSNSGITQAEGKKLGVYVLPMPFDIDGPFVPTSAVADSPVA